MSLNTHLLTGDEPPVLFFFWTWYHLALVASVFFGLLKKKAAPKRKAHTPEMNLLLGPTGVLMMAAAGTFASVRACVSVWGLQVS